MRAGGRENAVTVLGINVVDHRTRHTPWQTLHWIATVQWDGLLKGNIINQRRQPDIQHRTATTTTTKTLVREDDSPGSLFSHAALCCQPTVTLSAQRDPARDILCSQIGYFRRGLGSSSDAAAAAQESHGCSVTLHSVGGKTTGTHFSSSSDNLEGVKGMSWEEAPPSWSFISSHNVK